MSVIKLSVIIPSRNRPNALKRCLDSLNKERSFLFEIIVADDSSPLYYESYQKIRDQYKIKLIRGRKKGLYANHNLLFKSAKGTHIRAIDDDHIIPRNHIYTTLKFIKVDKKSIWSIGEKYPLKPYYNNKIFYPGELNNRGFSSKAKDINDSIALACGSSIYPKAIFTNKNFYIDKYPWGVMWLEYGARLKMIGYKIRIMPNNFVNHYYIEHKRSLSTLKFHLETKFFVIFFYNLIYNRNIKNILLGTYEILKQFFYYNMHDVKFALYTSYKYFLFLKKNNFWKKKF
jgi:glycosyltransferase involved in cell wall biosynthesis